MSLRTQEAGVNLSSGLLRPCVVNNVLILTTFPQTSLLVISDNLSSWLTDNFTSFWTVVYQVFVSFIFQRRFEVYYLFIFLFFFLN